MDDLTPLLIETTETVSANAICDCDQSYEKHDNNKHEVPRKKECHSCNDIGTNYDELYYVTKYQKCDEYCCAKEAKDCDCKPKYDCRCKEKPKHDRRPKHDCCYEEKKSCDCCCEKCKHDYCREKPKHDCCKHDRDREKHCPTKSCLKCSTPGGVSIPAHTPAGTTFTLTSLSIDTCKFQKPCIEFTFASNLVTTCSISSLSFQIFKQCKCQFNSIPVGPAWTFSIDECPVSDSRTFTFGVCDCDSCLNECCTYTVVATVTGVKTVGTIAIRNATLIALVVDNKNCNC
ncbi:MAG: DUF4489 domain-containing protein [Lachnospiraceae bacterium]